MSAARVDKESRMSITNNTDLAELAEQIEQVVSESMRMPTLDAMRALLNECGIRRARRALAEAPDRLAGAQAAFREAQAREAAAKEAHTQALVEAEWAVSGEIYKDGNKTYRWVPCGEHDGGEPTPLCTECNGSGKFRVFMLADEVAKWKATTAARYSPVVDLAAALRRAEEDTVAARDAVTVADKRLSALKIEVQAAIAELSALSVGLAAKGA